MSLLLRALSVAIGVLPFAWLRAAGKALGLFAGSVLRIRRVHVERSMDRAGVEQPQRRAREMYGSLGAGLFELMWMARAQRADLARVAVIDPASQARVDRARAVGAGVILAASHTGNWDLAACAFAATMPVTIVTKRLSIRSLDAFWQKTRASLGVGLVEAGGAYELARTRLAKGEAVAMMIDQVPASPRHAVQGNFMGQPAWLDRAPAALSARTGAPLLVAASNRRPDGTHALHALGVIVPPRRAGRAWIEAATREATALLESFVYEHPESWLWMHRRWKAICSAPS